jgi:hypothetical protein
MTGARADGGNGILGAVRRRLRPAKAAPGDNRKKINLAL